MRGRLVATVIGLIMSVAFPTSSASATESTGCKASANLPSTLVLSQQNTERTVTLTTNCPLVLASLTILSSTDETKDFISWSQDPATSGSQATWQEYASTYTAGSTYHTSMSSYGLNSDYKKVTITTRPMTAKNATYVTLVSAGRSGGTVTLKGTTRQWAPTGNYGSGATVSDAETVTVQRQANDSWIAVKQVRSTTAGRLTVSFESAPTHAYRLVVPATRRLATSTSKPQSA